MSIMTDDTCIGLFKKILALHSDAILVLDCISKSLIFVNPSAEKMFGYESGEMLGIKVDSLHPDYVIKDVNYHLDQLAKGEIAEVRNIACQKKNEVVFYCDIRGFLISEKETSYMLGFFHDNHQLRDIQQEKERLEEQVHYSQRLASLGSLAASVGHEINNPLAIAIAQLEDLQRQVTDFNPRLTDGFTLIFDSLERIKNIVWGLRNVSRTSADGDSIFDAHEVILMAYKLMGPLYDKDGILMIHQLNANHRWIKGNHENFLQVMLNILSNAKNAMREPGKILVRSYNQHEGLIIEIEDQGRGIKDNDLDDIYQSFLTDHAKALGPRLGLSIGHSIMSKLGGKIDIESTLGVGTTVRLSLPLILDLQEPLSKELQEAKQSSYGLEMKQLQGKVLVAEDESGIRRLLKKQLESFGMEVYLAENGLEAMRHFQQMDFDYLITDLKMPKVGGEELIKYLRPTHKNLIIIIITGGVLYNQEDEDYRALLDMVDGVLEKPFRKSELFHILASDNS